jgi:deoxyadenosine/deoxycytidine kinase
MGKVLGEHGYTVVAEILPPDLFQAFRTEPMANCAALQRAIMESRLRGWQQTASSSVAFDRSISEDIGVFCQLHHEAGLLTTAELDSLQTAAAELELQLPRPNLIVFLTAQRDVLRARIAQGGHPETIVSTLDRQLALYSEWKRAASGQLAEIDTTRLGAHALADFMGTLRQ